MNDQPTSRTQSVDGSRHVTDEKFNAVSHLCGAVFALAAGIILIVLAAAASKPWYVVGFSIYGLCLFLLFAASTLHHSIITTDRVIKVFRILDYNSIFLLIAGTYTPLCLGPIRSPLSWSILGVCWGVAIFGILIKSSRPEVPKWFTQTLYLCLGWMGIVLAWPLYQQSGVIPLLLLLSGGFFYSTGAIIFIIEKPNPFPGKFGFHEIWHILVLAGAATHAGMMFSLL